MSVANANANADAERLELAARLEAQLEEWIESLPRTPYKDGWPEDRWREEMDKHPFFMKEAPDLTKGDLPPLIEGLANLKFDPESNTPVELAANYKEDGNFYYKNKNYRLSVCSYTEGIKVNCGDEKLNLALYNNRAQSHYTLENYRSSLRDCLRVLSVDPDHRKSLTRAARCAFKLCEFEACATHCDRLLSFGANAIASGLKKKSEEILANAARENERRSRIVDHLKNNGIRMYDPTEDEESSVDLFLCDMPSIETPARIDERLGAIWPVILLYSQYHVYDYYQEYPEDLPLRRLIEEVLSETPSWDEKGEYAPDSINVYYFGRNKSLHPVDLDKTLSEVMREKHFTLRQLAPTFVVKLKNESSTLREYIVENEGK